VAFRRVVLSLQDVPNGNDVIGVHPDDNGVHGGALRCHLLPAEGAVHVQPTAGSEDHRPHLVGRMSYCPTVSSAHEDFLLPDGAED